MEQSVVMLPTALKKQIKLLSREKGVSVAELLWQALAEVSPQTELDRLQAKLATATAALDEAERNVQETLRFLASRTS